MSVLSYKKINKKELSELMAENYDRLQDFDIYHCLLDGNESSATKIQALVGKITTAYLEWLEICDGGLLFDTTVLASKDYDEELDLPISSIEEYNNADSLLEYGISDEYFIFAVRSYGDPICMKKGGEDERVYLWNNEQKEFEDVWDTFEDWLTEEIDEGIQLIADDVLDPLEIKLNGEDDGI